jgi:drug/metabolite transporter (DMT)-like permease
MLCRTAVLTGMPGSIAIALALLLLGAVWGLTPAMAKLAMARGMQPLGVAAIAAVISAVVLLLVCARRRDMPRWTRPHLVHYVSGGFVGLACANLFAFTGLMRAPAGLFALLVPLSGLLSTVFFAMAGIERATPRIVAGTLLGVAGVALAMAPGAALPDPALLPWAALMVLTPVCYAASNLLSVKLAVPGSTPLAQAAGTLVGAAGSVLVMALLLGQLGPPPDAGIAALLLAQGVLTALAYLIYFRLLVGAGGMVTSQVSYLITLAGLLYGYLLFDEVPGWLTLPAASLIFSGLALVTLAKRRDAP